MTISKCLKRRALSNEHGLSWYAFGDGGVRGLSMGVVKVDKAVPDWDTFGDQYGPFDRPLDGWTTIERRMVKNDETR